MAAADRIFFWQFSEDHSSNVGTGGDDGVVCLAGDRRRSRRFMRCPVRVYT